MQHLDGIWTRVATYVEFPSGHNAAAICLYGGVATIVLRAVRASWRCVMAVVHVGRSTWPMPAPCVALLVRFGAPNLMAEVARDGAARNGPAVGLEVLGQDPADCARWPSAGGGARASEPPNRT